MGVSTFCPTKDERRTRKMESTSKFIAPTTTHRPARLLAEQPHRDTFPFPTLPDFPDDKLAPHTIATRVTYEYQRTHFRPGTLRCSTRQKTRQGFPTWRPLRRGEHTPTPTTHTQASTAASSLGPSPLPHPRHEIHTSIHRQTHRHTHTYTYTHSLPPPLSHGF